MSDSDQEDWVQRNVLADDSETELPPPHDQEAYDRCTRILRNHQLQISSMLTASCNKDQTVSLLEQCGRLQILHMIIT